MVIQEGADRFGREDVRRYMMVRNVVVWRTEEESREGRNVLTRGNVNEALAHTVEERH